MVVAKLSFARTEETLIRSDFNTKSKMGNGFTLDNFLDTTIFDHPFEEHYF